MSLLQQLIDAHPRLMHGHGPTIPGYVRPGWHPIVMRLMSAIDAMLGDDLAAGFQVIQIKEKFGGLRFYFELKGRKDLTLDVIGVGRLQIPDLDEGDGCQAPRPPELERISALVEAAEEEAARTCEVCGAPGALALGGWIATLCRRHAELKRFGGGVGDEGVD
jgi:hypothetical protein